MIYIYIERILKLELEMVSVNMMFGLKYLGNI